MGRYVKPALKEINFFMRDWRRNKAIKIDTRTIDIIAASHNMLDVNEPYLLLSGYRTPQTNAMLRSRSRGVAKNSLHVRGMAADLRLKSRSVSQIARAAQACKARWRRPVLALQLRAYGLRIDPHLGAVSNRTLHDLLARG